MVNASSPTNAAAPARGPLAGLRVLDLTWHIAGPYCTKLLADYGADVIKVERPGSGDPARHTPPFFERGGVVTRPGMAGTPPTPRHGAPHYGDSAPGTPNHDRSDPEGSLLFLYLNTNKRSVTLDLGREADRRLFLDLARDAHVVVESFRPGVLDRLGIGWDVLHALNPRLILTSISNFGQTGPYRDLPASELVEYAISGLMTISGSQDREPLKHGLSQGQYSAGANAAYITAALAYTQALGAPGQWIDVSILECLASELVMNEPNYAWMGAIQGRRPPSGDGLNNIMPSKDGYVVLQMGGATKWPEIADLLGMPELNSEQFATAQARARNSQELDRLIGIGLKARTKHELFDEAAKRRILFGIAQDPADLLGCPQLTARGYWASVDHPATGPLPYPGEPVKMSATPWQLRRPAPLLGQHTAEVLAELGTGRAALDGARTAGAGGHTMRLPLEGIRVLDTSSVFAMPYTAGILADLGAEVIKIEALQRLDQTRGSAWGLWPDNDPGDRPWDRGGPFCTLNRGKRSLILDLSREEGRAILRDLVRISDIVIENYTARVMRGWGLDYPRLRELKPDIIHVSNTGYGHHSPWESYPVQGTALEPMTGISHFSGYIGDRPWKIAQSYPDFVATWHALFCIMAALRHRALTGEGQWLDVGMYQVNVSFLGEAILDYTANGRLGGRIGNRDHTGAVQGCYRCAGDERWLTVTARDDGEWRALRDLVGAAWGGRTPPATLAEAYARHDDVDAALSAWAGQREREEAVAALRAAGLPAGPVNDARDLLLDPHLRARGFYQMVEHAPVTEVGRRPLIGQPWKLSGTPVSIRRPAPPLGEANAYVLQELAGLSAQTFERLVAERLTGELDAPAEPPNPVPLEEQVRLGRIHSHDPAYRERLGLEQRIEVGD